MVKIFDIAIGTDKKKLELVRCMLKEEFALVAPKPRAECGFSILVEGLPEATEEEKLVWEDKIERVGRYRVDFIKDRKGAVLKQTEKGWEWFGKSPIGETYVYFRYWSSKLTPEINESDPMFPAILRAYQIIRPAKKFNAALPPGKYVEGNDSDLTKLLSECNQLKTPH